MYKTRLKIVSLVISMALVLSFFPYTGVNAANDIFNGVCGLYDDNLKWEYSYGTLRIYKNNYFDNYDYGFDDNELGKMAYWNSPTDDIPWGTISVGGEDYDLGSQVKDVIIEDGVTYIGDYAFSCLSNLESITIPGSVIRVGYNAFSGCSDFSIIISDGVTSIGDGEYSFSDISGFTSVTIPDSVTSIGNEAFSGCTGLASITIPDSVTSIGDKAFYDCTSLASITIPDSVTSIGGEAFRGCTSLTGITIPDGVTSIEI